MNIYYTRNVHATIQPKSVSGWTPGSCLMDADVRTLTGDYMNDASLTPQECGGFCSGYNFMVLEYGSSCYCGDQISNSGTMFVPQTDCTMACAGNSSALCGDAWRMNSYRARTVTSYVSVQYVNFCGDISFSAQFRVFYETAGQIWDSNSACNTNPTWSMDAPEVKNRFDFVQPTNLQISSGTFNGCKYTAGSGDKGAALGYLNCPGFDYPRRCRAYDNQQDIICGGFDAGINTPIFRCVWEY
jgi:hypothetical protein